MASSADDQAQPTFPSIEELDSAAEAAAAAFGAAADLDALAIAAQALIGKGLGAGDEPFEDRWREQVGAGWGA